MYAPSPVFSPLVGMGAKIGLKALSDMPFTPAPLPQWGEGRVRACQGLTSMTNARLNNM